MRIGQLARRLGIPPTEILGFLSAQNIEADGTNTRLSAEVVTKVINHFAPEKLSEIFASPVEEPVAEAPVVAEVEEEQPQEVPVAEEPQAESQLTPETPPEVIRVSKVELQGLKVLGKIELPEPKKKTETTEPTLSNEEQPSQPTQPRLPRKEYPKRNDRRDREWKNPMEQKRQQEAREAERKKQEQAERQKEKRTNHYYSKVKSVPTKSARRFEEQTVVEDVETKEPPKGIFGKFLRWLRT